MVAHKFVVIGCCLFFLSCKYNKQGVPNEQELLRKALHTIDWSKPDTYPTYTSCDSIEDEIKNRACFFETFTQDFFQLLKNDSLIQTLGLKNLDSLPLEVRILPNASFTIKLNQKALIKKLDNHQQIDSLLFTKSLKLKPVQPGTKRGVPVTTSFETKIAL